MLDIDIRIPKPLHRSDEDEHRQSVRKDSLATRISERFPCCPGGEPNPNAIRYDTNMPKNANDVGVVYAILQLRLWNKAKM